METNPQQPMSMQQKVALAVYFGLLAVLVIVGAIAVGWGSSTLISTDVRLAVIATLAGGLGALVQSTSSFITYAGERKLYTSWGWWYVMRPIIGAGLSLIFYFTFRGGLFVLSTSPDALKAENIDAFGVAAVGALVGMFSKEATDKLKEIAEAVFKKQERADSVEQAKPMTPLALPATVPSPIPPIPLPSPIPPALDASSANALHDA